MGDFLPLRKNLPENLSFVSKLGKLGNKMTIIPDLNRNVQPKDSNLKRNLSDLRDALKPVLLSILNQKLRSIPNQQSLIK